MWPIDSSFDESMNEQVLTMTTSAFSASGMTAMPAWCRWPTMISLSTRFLAQPREMRLTLIMRRKGGACWRAMVDGREPQRHRLQAGSYKDRTNKKRRSKDRRYSPVEKEEFTSWT